MRSLYEINNELVDALENAFTIDENGEIVMNEDKINCLQKEMNDKVDGIVCYIKDLNSLSEAIETEKKALEERIKANDKKVESLKNYVSSVLKMQGKEKFETARNKLSFRTSKSVNVVNQDDIPISYFNEKITLALDKKRILEELKQGLEVKGCELLVKDNLQIK